MRTEAREFQHSQYKVALEPIRGGRTVNEIAQEFGVYPTLVGLWKKNVVRLLMTPVGT